MSQAERKEHRQLDRHGGWDTSNVAMISGPLQPVCLHVFPVLPGVVLGPTTVSA